MRKIKWICILLAYSAFWAYFSEFSFSKHKTIFRKWVLNTKISTILLRQQFFWFLHIFNFTSIFGQFIMHFVKYIEALEIWSKTRNVLEIHWQYKYHIMFLWWPNALIKENQSLTFQPMNRTSENPYLKQERNNSSTRNICAHHLITHTTISFHSDISVLSFHRRSISLSWLFGSLPASASTCNLSINDNGRNRVAMKEHSFAGFIEVESLSFRNRPYSLK